MPRPRYTIKPADVPHAAAYLKPRLQTYVIHIREASHKVALKEFDEIIALRGKEAKAQSLNDWCELHLNSKEWEKLKTSIRKRRERKTRFGELQTISISQKAFDLVRKLSIRDGVTYSQTLENYLQKVIRAKQSNVR